MEVAHFAVHVVEFGGEKQELRIVADVQGADFAEASKVWLALLDQAVSGTFWDWSNGSDHVKELPEEGGAGWNEWLESEMANAEEDTDYNLAHEDSVEATDNIPLETLAEEYEGDVDEVEPDVSSPRMSDDVVWQVEEALANGDALSAEVGSVLRVQKTEGAASD
jgi:hypothetical protein